MLSESEQAAALARDFGLVEQGIDHTRADSTGILPEQRSKAPFVPPPEYELQPALKGDAGEFTVPRAADRVISRDSMPVEIRGGARPTSGQAAQQQMHATGVVFGPGGIGGSKMPPLVGRGEPARALVDPAAVKAQPQAHELRINEGLVERMTERVPAAALAESPRTDHSPAYPAHLGEGDSLPQPALLLSRGQVNTLQRLLDAPIPSPQVLISLIATKVSVEVAGMEGLQIDFSSAELAEIDRRATFWGLTRAETVKRMLDQVKTYMFEGSSI